MESWMVSLGIAFVGVVGTFATLRTRVARVDSELDKYIRVYTEDRKSSESKLNAQFRRVDKCHEDIAIMKNETTKYMVMHEAEKKFVQKIELDLMLKNIALTADNTNQKVDKMEGKLEELISLFSDFAVKKTND